MKKVFFILALLSVSFSFMACGDDDDNDNVITYEELPTLAKTFITTHFPDQAKDQVKKDNDSYDVYLSGYEIEFNLNGEWDSVDGKRGTQRNPIPQSILNLLPNGILLYVAETYPNITILEVDKEINGYEITLNNDVELKFNKDGGFLSRD